MGLLGRRFLRASAACMLMVGVTAVSDVAVRAADTATSKSASSKSAKTSAARKVAVRPAATPSVKPTPTLDAPRYPVDITAGRWTAATYWGHWTFPYWAPDGSDGHPAYSSDLPKVYFWSSYAATDWNLPRDADLGQQVVAVQAGTIVKVDARYGDVVIKHTLPLPLQDGTTIASWYSEYGHMRDIRVQVGQSVDKGVALGAVGDAGSPGGAHLHFVLSSDRSSGANVKSERSWAISPAWVMGDLGSNLDLYADELTTAAMRVVRYPADLYPATLLAKCCVYSAA